MCFYIGGDTVLQIQNLRITHNKDLRILIDNLNFTLNRGDKMAIIGEEGNGKSTILKAIVDLELVGYCSVEGKIIVKDFKCGYLAQELSESESQLTIYEYMMNVLDDYSQLPTISNVLGLDIELFYEQRKLSSLSGGEKVKIQIAKLILSRCDCFLLDEPSNDLDIETLEWLENFIKNSPNTFLYISHDEMLLENTATMILHIEQIKRKTECICAVFKMGYLEYLETRSRRIAHQQQMALSDRKEYDQKMERYRHLYERVNFELNAVSRQNPHGGQLLKKKMKSVKAMGKRFEKEKAFMTPKVEVEDAIDLSFDCMPIPSGKIVLDYSLDELKIMDKVLAKDIHLFLKGGESVCIVGHNGVGKSTLLKLIVDYLSLRSDLKVGYMPQTYEEQMDMSVSAVDFLCKSQERDAITKVRTYLGSMNYTSDEMNHAISELSGGQKAKLFLLKMNLDGCNVLLLDEPTRNFSPLSNPVIRANLASFRGVILAISHDRCFIREVCDKVYALNGNGLREVTI